MLGLSAFAFASGAAYLETSIDPIERPGQCYFATAGNGVGDIDGDGLDEILVTSECDAGVLLFNWGRAQPDLLVPPAGDHWSAPNPLGDIDGDGRDDFSLYWQQYVDGPNPSGVTLLMPTENGFRTAPLEYDGLEYFQAVGLGDWDGDGLPDLVASAPENVDAGVVHLYLGPVTAGSPTPIRPSDHRSYCLFGWTVAAVGDVDGDGLSDFSTTGCDGGYIYSADGSEFILHEGLDLPPGTSDTIWAGDINGDGLDDVPFHDVNVIRVKYGDGPVDITVEMEPESFQDLTGAGDHDDDGFNDVVVTRLTLPGIFLYYGSATGLVEPTEHYNVGSLPYTPDLATAGDVDGDGFLDVLTFRSWDGGGSPGLGAASILTHCDDGDEDGSCAQDDCDDADPETWPGAPDPWYDGIDQDCANNSDFDQDGDGYDSAEYGGDDCDDTDPDRHRLQGCDQPPRVDPEPRCACGTTAGAWPLGLLALLFGRRART